ncbi:uncharacterized protein LOC117321971 isoform X1 [Pecten maximus]|uniref:uncharacterized protein LOC117321971 isoform X1 n=2 Tax=Pecten maximus TaxID=6579 RepID=UPI0014587728|nr:uncharacterized protein LOC117321971 isoform X1 [Pecten maximus]XP_033732517.1 uncharacterized protein LOC117321971 isoform X1 [Pecten maximus]XP_033732523.1 uncharacterized protein LOC117321971 isoform X1 [Pecten maximus]
MVNTQELIAIIGGSIAGLIVLLVLIAIMIYCTCGRMRDSKNRGRSFQHLNSTTDASLSKNSNFGNGLDPHLDPRLDPRIDPRMEPRVDPRLPKVGSAGLWMGAPSMYSTGPSDAYYVDRPKRAPSLQRATSEQRLAQSANGHMVYQGNMQQLYHSQQVPSHVYHPYNSNYVHGGVHGGVYPYNFGGQRDRSIIVEYQDEEQYYHNYRRNDEDSVRKGSKVKRTHSDLTGTKRKKERKRRESPAFERTRKEERPRNEDRGRTASVEVHNRQKKAPPPPPQGGPRYSEEQSKSLDFNDQPLSTQCATDSAKLRAMQEKSREHELSNKWRNQDELKLNLPVSDDDERGSVHVRSYEYKGELKKPENRHSSSSTKTDGVARAYVKSSKHSHSNPAFSSDEIVSSTARKDAPSPGTKHRKLEKTESNTDGKQVSAAFGFLDNYLSDDDGESRAQSPQPFV